MERSDKELLLGLIDKLADNQQLIVNVLKVTCSYEDRSRARYIEGEIVSVKSEILNARRAIEQL